jgi:hypothetical protein
LTEALGARLMAEMRALGEAYAASMLRVLAARETCEQVCSTALATEVAAWRSEHFDYMERDLSSWHAYDEDCRRIRAVERGQTPDALNDAWDDAYDDEDDGEMSWCELCARDGMTPAECFGEFDPEQDLPDGVYEMLCGRAEMAAELAQERFETLHAKERQQILRRRNAVLRRLQKAQPH